MSKDIDIYIYFFTYLKNLINNYEHNYKINKNKFSLKMFPVGFFFIAETNTWKNN